MGSKLKIPLLVLLVHSLAFVEAQEIDSAKLINTEFITDQIENIASATDMSIDYSDLVEEYLFYTKNPIAINSSEREKLLELRLLNEVQLNELNVYLAEYGSVLSKYELAAIQGFDRQTVERILPFISFTAKTKTQQKLKFKDALRFGRHQLIMRYSQILEPSIAYSHSIDSAVHYPGSTYLGSPQKYYARYSYNYNQKLRFGITWEKDAGELLTQKGLSDSLQSLVGESLAGFNDFASAHLFLSDLGPVRKLVVGDYHLEFGQGLTLWSGLSFGKSSEATQVKKYGRGIVPNTSVNENHFMRGAALTLGFGGLEISGFYSDNNIDANLLVADEEVSGLLETGNHRTINELIDKNALNIQCFGANIAYRFQRASIGITASQTSVDLLFQSSDQIFRKFYFSGSDLRNYGIDFNYNFRKISLYGEFAANSTKGFAGIIGANLFLTDRFVVTLMYRNFGKEYFSFYNNPFRESSFGRNESAYYFGTKLLLSKGVSLDAYADFFSFPWLKYGVSSPSAGVEYLVQLNYVPNRKVSAYLRLKMEDKQEDQRVDYVYTPQSVSVSRKSLRFSISYTVFDFLILKNRVETLFYDKQDNSQRGYLMYQDVLYRPQNFPLSASFRYALFSTDGWDSRIYAYENDVLYAFSVPAYFDRGQRFYLMFKVEAFKNLDIWLRFARAIYRDKISIGSGADRINSNHKTEIKVQLKLSL